MPKRMPVTGTVVAMALLTLTACGGTSAKKSSAGSPSPVSSAGSPSPVSPAGSPSPVSPTDSLSKLTVGWGANPNPTAILEQEPWLQQSLGNVKVSWQTINSGAAAIQALSSGSLDISCEAGSPPDALAAAQGAPIQIIWINENAAEALAVNPKKIPNLAALRGQKLGTIVGSTMYFSLVATLEGNNIPVNSATILDAPAQQDSLAAYQRGDLAGVYLSNPWLAEAVQSGAKVLITSDQVAQNYGLATFDACITTKSFIAKHPSIVLSFLQNMNKATNYLYQSPAAADQVIATALHISVAQAAQQATIGEHPTAAEQATAKWLGTPSTAATSGVTSAMDKTVKLAAQLGRIAKPSGSWNPAAVAYPQFVDEIASKG